MIHITSISNPRLAQAFIDYMATQGIHLTMRPTNEPPLVELWLEDDSQRSQVEEELRHFARDPLNERYQAASWQTGQSVSFFKYHNNLNLNTLKNQSGPLTIAITLLCILVYLWIAMADIKDVMNWLAWPANSDQYLELWRWISPALLHFSRTHLLFNLALWWYFGSQVEQKIGGSKLFEITIVSAIFSNWAQSLFSGSNFGGLSGVVYALIGYVWLTGEISPKRGISAPRGLIAVSVIWLLVGYFDLFSLNIANAAHVAGLIIGLLMGLWDNLRKQKNQKMPNKPQ
ncbi:MULTISPECIES: rhomboid family intramembrane serine protease GlpG [Xenorhabdus]|uniref:rhomboid family intramembrane serine protease GlpG n=1 Tax=Xenorhabdus TaxID=626 RepID=UPI00064AF7E8|nr:MULTISPECIES: rhomboid family intramembrane serine protease GlpG [Xenorhabdus]KLU17272.1 intramembrane serine protease GlpG [Xenorhabdus griffiniae]KOP33164.1 intramembrane serine protease GlpG [Xenorhabdus sp. GDc328]